MIIAQWKNIKYNYLKMKWKVMNQVIINKKESKVEI